MATNSHPTPDAEERARLLAAGMNPEFFYGHLPPMTTAEQVAFDQLMAQAEIDRHQEQETLRLAERREFASDDPYASEDEEQPLYQFTPIVAALVLGVLLGVAFMLVVAYGIH